MIKAVLFDLDNTLITNPDEAFIARYLSLIDSFFVQEAGVDNVSHTLINCVRSFSNLTKKREIITNLQWIIAQLEKTHTIHSHQINQLYQQFIDTQYLELKTFITPRKLANQIIETLKSQSIILAIATNPLYPQKEILKRMAWGDLVPPSEFAFITHAENMHYAKPNPAYYAELVARVGVEPDEALMIGDSITNDIEPARRAGLQTFYIDNQQKSPLDELWSFIQEHHWYTKTPASTLTPQLVIDGLTGNLGAIYGLVTTTHPNMWHLHPDSQEWSIAQIITHLYESEKEIQRPRLQQIASSVNPFIASPAPQGLSLKPHSQNVLETLEKLTSERNITIELLTSWLQSSPSFWERSARHSIFGLTTLLEMAYFTTQHDRLHINQLCHTIGQCQENL